MDTIVVGNGPELLNQKNGALINSFRHIIRCNGFVIDGYEEYVGQRTTSWATTAFINKVNELSSLDTVYFMGVKGKDPHKLAEWSVANDTVFTWIPRSHRQMYLKRFPFIAQSTKTKAVISTGVALLLYLVYECKIKPYIIGFGGYQSTAIRYYNTRQRSEKRKEYGAMSLHIIEYLKENELVNVL